MSKKTYCITGFDCAHCASKTEAHLNKQDSIKECVIDFAADRLHIEFNDKDLSIDEIKAIIKEVESDPIEIKELGEKKTKKSFFDKQFFILLARVVVAIAIMVITMTVLNEEKYYWYAFGLNAFGVILLSYDIYYKLFRHIVALENPIDEYLLLSMTGIGTFIVASVTKETHVYMEAIMVLSLYQIGKMIEDFATRKSKNAIVSAFELKVETANLLVDGNINKVNPEELRVGDIVVVSNGEQIPTDGVIVEGNGEIDTSSLTGEFVPVGAYNGLEVFSGCLVSSGSIKIRVNKEYKDSAINKVNELIINSGAKKSKADHFVTKFARVYTPIILGSAIIVGLIGGLVSKDWETWTILGLKMLVVGCPCAIVISVPLAYFAAIGLASKNGVVVKGANYLDELVNLKKVVTDKTGTLTKGTFKVTKVVPNKVKEEELLSLLVAVESFSSHPIAKAISKHHESNISVDELSDYQEMPGYGVSASYKDKLLIAGNSKMFEMFEVEYTPTNDYGVVIHVALGDKYLGYVVLNDEIKDSAKEMVALLKKDKIETVLLTGDKEENAKELASILNIDAYHSELLPEDKVNYLDKEMTSKGVTAYLGDGINDAASIKRANVGFAMGAIGSDSAIESADVIVMNDDPSKVYDTYKVAKIARHTSLFNIIFALIVKFGIEIAALLTSSFGHPEMVPMWLAVLADTGLTVLMVINSLLILYRKIKH